MGLFPLKTYYLDQPQDNEAIFKSTHKAIAMTSFGVRDQAHSVIYIYIYIYTVLPLSFLVQEIAASSERNDTGHTPEMNIKQIL